MKEPAHVAYDAFGDALGWREPLFGKPIPTWDLLIEPEREAWRAAVKALHG